MDNILESLIAQEYTIVEKGSKWATTSEHDSLVIDREKQIFFWNSRNIAGDALTWLTKIKGFPFSEARKILANFRSYSETFVYTIKSEREDEDIIVYPKLVEVFWEEGLQNRNYWYNRLLNDDVINRFQLGYHDGWYTIPLFMDGTFRNFQCRRDVPLKSIRPWYRGIGPMLFNSEILKLVDNIIITEGTVDAIYLNQIGFPAISHTTGAGWMHKLWFDRFVRQRDIVYIADNDKAGLLAAKKVAESLSTNRVRILTFDGYSEKYDTIEFFRNAGTLEEFKELLDNARYLEEFGGIYEIRQS